MKRARISSRSFSDLPKDIVVKILIRLPVKRILVVKCVSKTWYDLISDPEFAKLHFDRGEVYPLIQRKDFSSICLVLPDKDDFELKLGMCDHTHSKSGCVCNVRIKLDKFELPDGYGNEGYSLGTCNGFLCMSNPPDYRLCPGFIYNPITGERINLPKTKEIGFNVHGVRYGFGFSPSTKQYKVIRMSPKKAVEAQIHILGTKTWKNIGFFTQGLPWLSPTYLNGFLYWSNRLQPLSICTFDVEKETFGSVSTPQPYQYDSVGVLGGELCVCGVLESGDIHVWTMKDNGIGKEWSKVFSFDPIYVDGTRDYGPWLPIKYLNNGALLMFYSPHNAFVYMDPKEKRFRYLKIRQSMSRSKPEAIVYTPTIVSLKHALSGHSVKIVKWSCILKYFGGSIEIDEEEFQVN